MEPREYVVEQDSTAITVICGEWMSKRRIRSWWHELCFRRKFTKGVI